MTFFHLRHLSTPQALISINNKKIKRIVPQIFNLWAKNTKILSFFRACGGQKTEFKSLRSFSIGTKFKMNRSKYETKSQNTRKNVMQILCQNFKKFFAYVCRSSPSPSSLEKNPVTILARHHSICNMAW